MKIINRFTGAVLYESPLGSLTDCVVQAIQEGADLEGANLKGADLRYINFEGADLIDADLRGADLRGTNLSCAGRTEGAAGIEQLLTELIEIVNDWRAEGEGKLFKTAIYECAEDLERVIEKYR